jgi:L-asparaginase II
VTASEPHPALLATVDRDGVVESVHRGHVVVCDERGVVVAALGAPALPTYVRSAAKPFQALAVLDALDAAGATLGLEGLAMACASHVGADEHQIEAAYLLACAGLDETALRCPPAIADDVAAARSSAGATRLAHNCSGKHAAFLLAQVAGGGDPTAYLDVDGPLQVAIRERLGEVCGATPTGPGVDGCGAPAWVLPLDALAMGFARLAGATGGGLARVATAMRARPDLVGGSTTDDVRLMRTDPRIVAKRGAEAVFGAGVHTARGALGVAVKIADGGNRAAGPVAAAVLAALGATVPGEVREPVVLGGGTPHGALRVTPALAAMLA